MEVKYYQFLINETIKEYKKMHPKGGSSKPLIPAMKVAESRLTSDWGVFVHLTKAEKRIIKKGVLKELLSETASLSAVSK